MSKTYVNALVYDKANIGIDEVVRKSLRTFYQRNLFIDVVVDNPIRAIIETSEDVCLEQASNLGFDYLILTWEGNIFDIHVYHYECVKYIESLGDTDWLVAGHIIDQEKNRILFNDTNAKAWENSFWLFPITAIVNIKTWERLGKPRWGQDDGLQIVTKAIPDVMCVHDDYTPLSIISGQETITIKTKKGWNIINAALSNGLHVINLNDSIRSGQNYLYPENDVTRYNEFWRSLHMMPKLTNHYKKVLEKILPSKYPRRIDDLTWQCFIRNTENYFPEEVNYPANIDYHTIDAIALPSSGFKDFIISMSKKSARKPVEVVHFDIIKECTEIRRKIIEQWDGSRETFCDTLLDIGKMYRSNPIDIFHMHSMKNLIEAYDHLLTFFHHEEDLKECWQKFKTFDHSYIEADLLDDPWPVIKIIKSKSLYICLSDIAGWRNNIIGYGYQNLRQDIVECLGNLISKDISGYIDYKDPGTDLQMWQTFEEAITNLQ